jgi:hypothetical protein
LSSTTYHREHFKGNRATASPQRASSPPSTDEPEDEEEELDPILQRIRAEVASRTVARKTSSANDVFGQHDSTQRSGSGLGNVESVEELVEIRVSLIMDPDKPASERARQAYERPIPITCPAVSQ